MTDEMEGQGPGLGAAGRGGDPAALALAVGGASRDEADSFLREQKRFVKLQSENLIEQNAFELSHLRWRRFNDQMKGALQIMIVAVGALVVVGIGTAMWNAGQAEGLVVDAFAVPPSYEQTGITGNIIADDMTGKIAAIRDFANDHSLARSSDVREDRAQDVKVEIPETGVSLAEAWRYLRLWLGHERHLNGNLRSLGEGRIALTASLGGSDSYTFTGLAADLDSLEQQAAERTFAITDPINNVLYLAGKGRYSDALAASARNVSLAHDRAELAEVYSLYANMVRDYTGNVAVSSALARLAISLDPKQAPSHMELLNASRALGHDEEILQQARVIAGLRREDNVGSWRTSDGVPFVWQLGALYRAVETGDFSGASTQPCIYECSHGDAVLQRAENLARLHDASHSRALVAEALQYGSAEAAAVARTQYFIHAATDDWQAAVSDGRRIGDAMRADKSLSERFQALRISTQVVPLLAYSLAMSGDISGARAAIGSTPSDCILCLRVRGQIEALQRHWSEAAHWYAIAVHDAPSVPFAYSDWGAMLLRKGDYDAAIAKLTLAERKGPHFADLFELWGEALMLKNRSDLALAKFADAGKYAPNWGRLHMKWGEALGYVGRTDEARVQYRIASALDLSAADKKELASRGI